MTRETSAAQSRLTLLGGFMSNRRSWDQVRAHLDPDIAVRVVDLPGHEVEPGSRVRGFSENVASIGKGLENEGKRYDTEILVGYSMGGRVALALAVSRPSLFDHLITVGADLGLANEDSRRARVAEDEARARALETGSLSAFVDAWEALPIFATQSRLSSDVTARQRAARLGCSAEGLAFALRNLGTGAMPDQRQAMSESWLPMTFVAGQLDHKFAAIAEEAAHLVTTGAALTVPDAGHNLLLEAPRALAEIVARVVSRERGQKISTANTKAINMSEQLNRDGAAS